VETAAPVLIVEYDDVGAVELKTDDRDDPVGFDATNDSTWGEVNELHRSVRSDSWRASMLSGRRARLPNWDAGRTDEWQTIKR
jgi:hypothetical protein